MDEQLLIRFLTHTCTSEDLRLVDQWIASGKPNADWLFEMERIWSLKDELRFSDRRLLNERDRGGVQPFYSFPGKE